MRFGPTTAICRLLWGIFTGIEAMVIPFIPKFLPRIKLVFPFLFVTFDKYVQIDLFSSKSKMVASFSVLNSAQHARSFFP